MKTEQIFNLVQGEPVVRWVVEQAGTSYCERSTGIGMLKDGMLVAGMAYERYSGPNVNVHIAIAGRVTREFWHAVSKYPFEELGCVRVTAIVLASNKRIRNLMVNIGFELEGTMKNAGQDGGDLLMYVLWRDKCRMLDWKPKS